MEYYQVETKVTKDGKVIVPGVPFKAGDKVKVTIESPTGQNSKKSYSLRGQPYQYQNPFLPVADEDWDSAQ